jgi:hypothetical protein
MAVTTEQRSSRDVRKLVALGAAAVTIVVGLAVVAAKDGNEPQTAMRESVNKAGDKTTTTSAPPKTTTTPLPTALPPPVTVPRTTEPEPAPAPAPEPEPEPEPAPAPAPAPATPRGAQPDASNTGPTVPESALRRVTPAQLESEMHDGAVIENVYITGGDIDVKAKNVTLRNFVIDASGSAYGIRSCGVTETDCGSRNWAGGFVAEDGIIRNASNAALWGGGVTFRRLETYAMAKDAFKPLDDVTIEGTYSHGPWGTADGAHADWIQFQGEANNVRIVGNTCAMAKSTITGNQKANACVQINREVSSLGVLVENNWMEGGNYTANCSGPAIGGIRFVNNIIGRDFNFGPQTGCGSSWINNTFPDGSPAT